MLARQAAGLRAFTPSYSSPGTAVALVLSSVALLGMLHPSARGRLLGRACAIGSLAIEALAIMSPRIGLARPAIATVIAVALLDGALLLLDQRVRERFVAHWIALGTAAIALVAIAGYAFDAPAFYHYAEQRWGVAIASAFALLALAVGVLFARPTRGLLQPVTAQDAGGRLLRRVLPLAIAIPALWALLLRLARSAPNGVPIASAALAVGSFLVTIVLLFAMARLISREARAQQRAESLVASSTDAIVDTDLDGIVCALNAAAEHFYGYRTDEIVGRSVYAILPPEQHQELSALRREVVSRNRRAVLEGFRVHKDGSRLFAATTLSPILDTAGRIVGISAISHDLSARHATELALERAVERERRLARALERTNTAARSVSAALVDMERNGSAGVVHEIAVQAAAMTRAATTAIGIGAVPALPFTAWVELGPEGRDVERSGVVPRAGHTVVDRPDFAAAIRTPIRFRDDTIGCLFIVPGAGPDAATHEEIALIVGMLADRAASAIEVARAYEREARGRAWMETMMDQIPDPVGLIDLDARVTRRNRAALALESPAASRAVFGTSAMFDVRTPAGDPVPADARPLTRVIRDRETVRSEEYLVRTAAGRDVPLLVDAAPVYDAPGRLIGAVIVARDITAQKQLERLRTEWTSLVAHDLRQPVSVVKLSSDLLLVSLGDDPRAREHVARIRRATGTLERMIDDLLQVTVLESNRLSVDRKREDLGSIVRDTVTELVDAGTRQRLTLSTPSGAVYANVDAVRMRQVVGNLVTNALKYSVGGSEISLVARREGASGVISVTNRGRGIAPQEIAHIFDRFTRTARTRESNIPGLGLGLAIAKGIVEAHHGRIDVTSTPDGETTFTVAIPLAENDLPAANVLALAADAGASAAVPPSRWSATQSRVS